MMKAKDFYKNQYFIYIILLTLSLTSCADNLFSPSIIDEGDPAPNVQVTSSQNCSQHTLIRPPVDFLFIWDNSTSTYFINNQTRQALNNTIDLISERFDYHVMVAPLIGQGNNNAFFISDTTEGLSHHVINNLRIDRTLAGDRLMAMPKQGGSYEAGLSRAVELLSSNMNNGIFRQNAYTMIVIMSNTDDNSWIDGALPDVINRDQYFNDVKHQLLCLRGHYGGNCSGPSLNSLQMRFMSIVLHSPHHQCPGISQGVENYLYRNMSHQIYTASYTDGRPTPNDQFYNPSTPDSYNICQQSNFAQIFDGINNSITDQVIRHRYRFWPVATAGAKAIDPNEIKVTVTGTGQEIPQITPSQAAQGASGFTFNNQVRTVDTRYYPTAGEPFTGYVVELHGNARISYPTCLTVTTQTPKEYFGYVRMHSMPQEDSITLRINGQVVPKGGSNGWELMKNSSGMPRYFQSKNIKIQGPGNYQPALPALNRSGYFLRLNGNSIYSNGDDINVTYLPCGTDSGC